MSNKRSKNYDRIKDRPLDPKQRKFVLCFMANGGNATQAAMEAGFTRNYESARTIGWQLVHTTANVSHAITKIREQAAKNTQTDADYVLRSLREIADACKAKRVERDPETGDVKEKGVVDSAGANKALELLGKNLRLFVESLEVTRKGALADMSDEELLQMWKATSTEGAGKKEKKSK